MPRYFFNHRAEDGQCEIDIDGLKLPSLNTALDEATFAAQSAITLSGDPTAGCFEIEDEGRVVVARVPYASNPTDEADDSSQPPAQSDEI